jgi:hypothetical protein
MSSSTFTQLFEFFVEHSGVMDGHSSGTFSTHCTRRGSAQYRINYAPVRWSFATLKWWYGWSGNEGVRRISFSVCAVL